MGLPQKTGSLATDANNRPVQLPTGLAFQDAAGSPIISPKASVPVTPQLLTVPANAVVLVVKGDAAIRVGTSAVLDGSAGKGYRKVAANVEARVPCAGVASIYVAAEASTVNVDFHFELLA